MTYLMFLLTAVMAVGGAVLFYSGHRRGLYSDLEFVFWILGFLCELAALVLLIFSIIIPISAGYDKRQCYRYGSLTGREVKYKRFSYWTWDCYVRTRSGNWISKDQVRGVDQ